jgi:hypothetical protein
LGFRRLRGCGLVAVLFDAAELGEGAEVAALEARKLAEHLLKGVAAGGVGLPGVAEAPDEAGAAGQSGVKLGLRALEPAAEPVAEDEGIDEVALDGGRGTELVLVFGGEAFEIGLVFAGDDGLTGIDAVFQGVEAGDFLASGGSRPGGLLRVQPVGLELVHSYHVGLRVAGRHGGSGRGLAAGC